MSRIVVSDLLKRLSLRRFQELLRLKKRQEKIDGLERQRDKLITALARIRKKISRLSNNAVKTIAKKAKKLSAATKKKIADAMKKHWAKQRKGKAAKAK